MAKKTQKTDATPEEKKPAARRGLVAKSAAKPAAKAPEKATVRRTSGSRTRKAVAAAADAGLTASALAAVTAPAEPTHDEIAERAYFIYLRREGAYGDPDQDWVSAVAELKRERGLI
jgi:hypothetical protein